MPNSIKCKIKHLCHNGTLTERERDRILKALEQEPVLDKIRAEIEQEQDDFMDDKDYDEGVRFGLMMAYQIIDKYTADREGFNE